MEESYIAPLSRWGLMRQAVDDVIDAKSVGLIRGVEREDALSGPLPVLGHIVAEVGHDQEPLCRIVVLEDAVIAWLQPIHRRQNGLDVFDAEERVEDHV